MTAPLRCECTHPKHRHDLPGFDGECVADGCHCTTYRPVTEPADTTPVQAVAPRVSSPGRAPLATVEQVVAAARELTDRRSQLVASRIEHLTAELRNRIYAERNRARDDQLAAEIQEIKHRGKPDKTCPDCGRTGLRNLGVHRRNAHGVRVTADA